MRDLKGMDSFNNITHLEAIGDKHHGVLDRFLAPFESEEKYDNRSFVDFDNKDYKSELTEGDN